MEPWDLIDQVRQLMVFDGTPEVHRAVGDFEDHHGEEVDLHSLPHPFALLVLIQE
jgi:hypothetical protein